MTTTTLIPLNKLTASPANVRKERSAANIEALAASILAQGLLQNLVVSPNENGLYQVDAGGRRFAALSLLVQQGKLPEDWPVPVRVVDPQDSTAASLTENVQREAMHPADEFDAFQKLTAEGWTIDRIADAFGVTPLVVERRLKLTKAAPELLALFRAGEITTDQLIALCATDDHERQVSVWRNSMSWNRDPASLRRAVLADEIDASRDPRVAFIGGIEAYVAAGGEVRRDLFSTDGQGGFIRDVALLERLVAEKLEATAEQLRAEGWGWVEIWPTFDYTAFHRFGRIHKSGENLPEDVAAQVKALREEYDALLTEQDEIEAKEDEHSEAEMERLQAIYERTSEIDSEIEDIEEAHATYAPEAMANAGAIVIMERGAVRIERGLVRTADRAKVAEAIGTKDAVTGGRETEAAGRKANELSDALRRSLLGHRNLAAQTATAANPQVAKVLLACWMVQDLRHQHGSVPTDFRIADAGHGTRTYHPITDDEGPAKKEAFDKIGADLIDGLPKAEGPLWDALSAMSADELDKLIAYAVARSVSLASEHKGLTAKLLTALGFNMSDHFTATVSNYLGRVSKELIIEALTEAGQIKSDAERAALLTMKKAALAAEAEKRLAGTGWVPKVVRTPKPKQPKADKPAAKKAAKAQPKQKAALKGKARAESAVQIAA